MVIAVRAVVGVLLLAHGLVHLLYLAPDVPQFSIGRSWLLPAPARRPVARVLMAATVAVLERVMYVNEETCTQARGAQRS